MLTGILSEGYHGYHIYIYQAVGAESIGLTELMETLKRHTYIPQRSAHGPLIFSVDHCFSIKGQGTVMTGTVLNGGVAVNDVSSIYIFKKVYLSVKTQ